MNDNIIYFPNRDDISPFLNQLPNNPDEYKARIKSLSNSVKEYSIRFKAILEEDQTIKEGDVHEED